MGDLMNGKTSAKLIGHNPAEEMTQSKQWSSCRRSSLLSDCTVMATNCLDQFIIYHAYSPLNRYHLNMYASHCTDLVNRDSSGIMQPASLQC